MPSFTDLSLATETAKATGNGIHKIVRNPGSGPRTQYLVIDGGMTTLEMQAARSMILEQVAHYFRREELVAYEFITVA